MTRLILLFIFSISIIGCKRRMDCGISHTIIAKNDSLIEEINSNKEAAKFWEHYRQQTKEPSLQKENHESYRLIVYNLMSRSSKTYRIFKKADSYKIIFKEFGNDDIYLQDNKLSLKTLEKDISQTDWNDFKKLTNKIGFWSLPVQIDRTGLDGTSYVLEGKMPKANNCTNRKYHIVGRWQPTDTMKIMELNRKFVALSHE